MKNMKIKLSQSKQYETQSTGIPGKNERKQKVER